MGAPHMIAAPTKAYVAINCFSSDKSIPPTLCDLGRVSSIASAVTMPRTSNYFSRNIATQNSRSICHAKRPISEILENTKSEGISASTPHASAEANTTRIQDSTSQLKLQGWYHHQNLSKQIFKRKSQNHYQRKFKGLQVLHIQLTCL